MNRDDALQLVRDHIKRENLYKHVLAVEAILRSVAEVLGEDVEKWGLLGLLHDLDFDEVQERPEQHGLRSVEMLAGKIDDELLRGIKAHNFEHTGVKPESRMEKALIAADAVSGLIIACALVMPSKKLTDVKPQTVIRRLKEKDFARGCNRRNVLLCEEIGLPWSRFAELSLRSLQEISGQLGL